LGGGGRAAYHFRGGGADPHRLSLGQRHRLRHGDRDRAGRFPPPPAAHFNDKIRIFRAAENLMADERADQMNLMWQAWNRAWSAGYVRESVSYHAVDDFWNVASGALI